MYVYLDTYFFSGISDRICFAILYPQSLAERMLAEQIFNLIATFCRFYSALTVLAYTLLKRFCSIALEG